MSTRPQRLRQADRQLELVPRDPAPGIPLAEAVRLMLDRIHTLKHAGQWPPRRAA